MNTITKSISAAFLSSMLFLLDGCSKDAAAPQTWSIITQDGLTQSTKAGTANTTSYFGGLLTVQIPIYNNLHRQGSFDIEFFNITHSQFKTGSTIHLPLQNGPDPITIGLNYSNYFTNSDESYKLFSCLVNSTGSITINANDVNARRLDGVLNCTLYDSDNKSTVINCTFSIAY